MTRRKILQLVFHGLLLVVLGMLVGVPFREAITGESGPEAERAWRVAHTSLVMGGVLYLSVAAIAHYLVLSSRAASFVVWSLVFSVYAFAFGFIVGPAIGARGLEPTGTPLQVTVFVVFALALTLAFLSMAIVLWGAFMALHTASSK